MTDDDLESQRPLTSYGRSATGSPRDKSHLLAPFTTQVFGEATNVASLLPATHRDEDDEVVCPQGDLKFLGRELLVNKIDDVEDYLWLCGRMMPPRPLHHQRLLGREITITENPILHLVWGNRRIFIKPLPRFLLDVAFWQTHILARAPQRAGQGSEEQEKHQHKVAKCARGFLFSYCALIAYESDHRIALENGLVPDELTWEKWRSLSGEVLRHHDFCDVNPRYWYGELRLSRLNKVYRIVRREFFRGFSRAGGHESYVDLLRDNFTTLAAVLGYVVIVLTAMQLGLTTKRLEADKGFQRASFVFTIFSILAPLASIVLILLTVLCYFIFNYMATKRFLVKRSKKMGVKVK